MATKDSLKTAIFTGLTISFGIIIGQIVTDKLKKRGIISS